MKWLQNHRAWLEEGRDLERRSVATRERIAELLAELNTISQQPTPERWLDLDRVIAVKWGDKVIDPSEVVYVLREAK